MSIRLSVYPSIRLLFALAVLPACGNDGNGPGGSGSFEHNRAPGASARDFLTGAPYTRLVVEVQYIAGFRPTDAALSALSSFLNARLNKPGGIEVRIGAALPVPGRASWSVSDIRALEQQRRTVYTSGTTLAAWMVFLDGAYSEGANVLGIAYNNTSMAVFEQKIIDNTGGPLEPSQTTVEATVANHELGHLLGLVNNGSMMQTEHQDEPNGEHCDDPNCLMHYSVRLSDFLSNLLGGMPQLNAQCLADLVANGGKG